MSTNEKTTAVTVALEITADKQSVARRALDSYAARTDSQRAAKIGLLFNMLDEQAANGCTLTQAEIIRRFRKAGYTPSDARHMIEWLIKWGDLTLEPTTDSVLVSAVVCCGGDE